MPRPATCHPELPRKTKDGLCRNCWQRRRYATDPVYREKMRAMNRAKEKRRRDAYTPAEREQWKADARERYRENVKYHRDYHLRENHRLTLGDYEALYEEQGGKCAICGGEDSDRHLGVDHDHATGLVRGLLCRRCNAGIGFLRDDPVIVEAARDYLRQHSRTT